MALTETSLFPTGLRLVAARLALKKSQAALCRALIVQTNTWNQWEKGIHKPDVDAMIRLGDRFGITLDWIFRERAEAMAGDLPATVLDHYERLKAEADLAKPA